MSRILIDISRLLYRRATGTLPTGIDRVSLEYVRHFGGGARAVLSRGPFSVILSEADSRAAFDAVRAEPSARALAARLVLKAVAWRWLVLGRPGDVLFNTGHYGLESPRHAWNLRRGGARVVAFVHDLIPITHARYCRPGEDATHRTRMRSAATLARGIIVNSRHTLAEFTRFCEDAGLRVPAAAVAPLGLGLTVHSTASRPLEDPYFVVLGTLEPRKNHAMLLRIWERMSGTPGAPAPKLVVIGQAGWDPGVASNVRAHDSILYRGRCTDDELAGWLRHAQALLFPSFAEGYGMPVVEALAAGVPVIASDLPVFREIAGGIPDYAEAGDEPRWEALVRDYAQAGSALRAGQLDRLRAFSPPAWERHFQAVEALLPSIAREA